jgi:hypothetical protein
VPWLKTLRTNNTTKTLRNGGEGRIEYQAQGPKEHDSEECLSAIEETAQAMSPSEHSLTTFIAFVAAIGVGTIISAFVGHLVAISNHRQDWINALRDDLAEFFKSLDAMGYAVRDYMHDSVKYEDKRREARIALLFIFQRIRLRLNRTEDLHIELEQRLREFLDNPLLERLENQTYIDKTVDLSRIVLKREWEVIKYPWKSYYEKIRPYLMKIKLLQQEKIDPE